MFAPGAYRGDCSVQRLGRGRRAGAGAAPTAWISTQVRCAQETPVMPRWLPVHSEHIAMAELSVRSQSVRKRIETATWCVPATRAEVSADFTRSLQRRAWLARRSRLKTSQPAKTQHPGGKERVSCQPRLALARAGGGLRLTIARSHSISFWDHFTPSALSTDCGSVSKRGCRSLASSDTVSS